MRGLHMSPEAIALVAAAVHAYKSPNAAKRRNRGFADAADLGKGIIMNVARSFNNWRKYRQTVTELGRMSTRELNDLGISRSEITSVARAAIR